MQDNNIPYQQLLDLYNNSELEIQRLKNENQSLERSNRELLNKNEELQASIKESEALYKSVIEHSLDGTIIVDEEFTVVYGNEEIFKITGFTLEEMIGQDIRFFIETESILTIEQEFAEVAKLEKEDNRFDCTMRHKDGGKRYVYISASLMDDFQGKRAFVAQVLDITDIKSAQEQIMRMNLDLEKRVIERTAQLQEALSELKTEVTIRKKTEQELQHARDEVMKALHQEKELNGLKTRFISMISHEYRTPLTVILTSSYLIEQYYQGPHRDQFDKFLDKIRSSVKSMTQLLEDVLTIGKSDAGKSTIFIDRVRIVDILSDIIEEAQVIDTNHHKFVFNYEHKDITIDTDLKSLRHVMSNLILNAAKYSPNAKEVIITIEDFGNTVQFTVQDFGIGIPVEDQPLLFEAFNRASNVGAISGTGLGLAIVKKMLDNLKGHISLKSARNEGSTFTIVLPKSL